MIEASPDAWDELVASSDEALAFHRRGWVDTAAEFLGGHNISRMYEWNGRRALIPLIRVGGVFGPLGIASSLPYGWGFGGVLTQGRVMEADVRSVVDDLSRAGLARVSLRPNPLAAEAWASAVPPGTPSVTRTAHVLSLDGGFGEVWSHRFVGSARTDVRRAEKSDLSVDVSRSDEAMAAFYHLYELSWRRWGEQRKTAAPLRWLADRRRERIGKFQAAAAALRDDFAIWIARSNGVPIAAVVVLSERGATSYWRGAMDQAQAGPTRANYLLLKLAIEAACASGARTFHMGDTAPGSSLAHFKTRFGAEPIVYREYHLERLPVTAAMARVRRMIG